QFLQLGTFEIGDWLRRPFQHGFAILQNLSYHSLEISYLGHVAVVVAPGFAKRISSKFFEKCLCEYERRHRFGNHSSRRYDRDVTTLVSSQRGFAGWQIDRFERPSQCRDRLQE